MAYAEISVHFHKLSGVLCQQVVSDDLWMQPIHTFLQM